MPAASIRRAMVRASAVVPLCFAAASLAQTAAIVGKVGTLGYGADIVVPILESANARIGASGFSKSRNFHSGEIDYEGKLELRTAALIGDWFPIAGNGFRLSGGAMYNGNRGKVLAKPSAASTYVFNGVTYQASDVGEARGEMSFRHFAPYLGIGWGNPVAEDTNWSFNFDLGVMFQGTPRFRVAVTCSASLSAAQCDQLQRDADGEAARVEQDYRKYRFYPVVSFGVGKKF